MAIYNRHKCGHFSTRDHWKSGPDVLVDSLCVACRAARIGEEIEFARFGRPPASGQSLNHRDGCAEAGVSVYEVVGGEPQFCGWYFNFLSRPEYRGRGIITGWGSDGEPLVKILKIRRMRVARTVSG